MSPTTDSVPSSSATRAAAAAAKDDARNHQRNSRHQQRSRPRRHVVFLHLDWGIGGAEQLMLQLATAAAASSSANNEEGNSTTTTVALRTTHCDPSHCFASLKPGSGALHPHLRVRGAWIPAHVTGGRGQALCSTVRLLYLAYVTARELRNYNNNSNKSEQTDTLIVLDVLPTPLWILRCFTDASLLFYCHFPDQLLLRQDRSRENNVFFRWYRRLLDALEERSMKLADTVCVNSQFTQQVVRQTFPSLNNTPLPVLYPALEVDDDDDGDDKDIKNKKNPYLIVSLNRFERKKNLGLLLEAVAWLQQHEQSATADDDNISRKIQVVIAGGYDPRNVENVEYRGELGRRCAELQLQSSQVQFRQSVSDADRRQLLATAAAVAYTPSREHFGIVPLEAMHAGTAVVCANSGGPVETVIDGATGFLCDTTPEAFGRAILAVVRDPDRAAAMGQAGRRHVLDRFGPDRLAREWSALAEDTLERGRRRRQQRAQHRYCYRVVRPRTLLYLAEAAAALLCVALLTGVLRMAGLLRPSQSILGGVRSAVGREEL